MQLSIVIGNPMMTKVVKTSKLYPWENFSHFICYISQLILARQCKIGCFMCQCQFFSNFETIGIVSN